jgi:hypothetical protein
MRKCDFAGMGGGLEIDGDREDAAELSPVLGITGNRALGLRFEGAGLNASIIPSLQSLSLLRHIPDCVDIH